MDTTAPSETAPIPTAADLEERARRLRVSKAWLARRAGVSRPHLTQVLNEKEPGSKPLRILIGAILDKVEALGLDTTEADTTAEGGEA
ncbi:MAG: hypothetical protein AAF791_04555 [Bacteroidota bacterium]